ncbi:MAG: right-handed parallel beta-helix repeat-containing protein [Archaeoglobus sp.]|nr:right-handed parallel beta-helix repeat-containing protein [Archaeoglobus sp.]
MKGMKERGEIKDKEIRHLKYILIVFVLFATSIPVSAETIEVCEKCSFSTIQDAINASNEGDTIAVSSGMYRENLKILNSVKIVGNKTTLEPEFRMLSTIQVMMAQNFTLENMEIKNGSTGIEAKYLKSLEIKNCVFENNFKAITMSQVGLGKLDGLKITGFVDGVKIDQSSSVEIENSLFDNGINAVSADASDEVGLSNLTIDKTETGIEFSGGERNLVESSTFSGKVFISAFSERGLVAKGNDVKGTYAIDGAMYGNLYVFNGLNVSGGQFHISVEEVEVPEGFVQLSDAINATITPDIYTEEGYVYLKMNLDSEKIEDLSNRIDVSTLAFYHFTGSNMERVSDYYNSSNLTPLGFTSNKSGIYVLAAEKIQPRKPTATPLTTPSMPISTPVEQPKWIPGFESIIAAIGIFVALILRERWS